MSILINTDRISGPIPEGVHPFEVVEIKLSDEPGASGYHYLIVTMKCIETGVESGKQVWSNVSMSPNARFIMEAFLDALDVPKSGGEIDITEFNGARVRCLIKHQEWDGRVSAGVDKWLPLGDVGGEVVPKRKDLASLKAKAKSRRPRSKKVEDVIDLEGEVLPPE